MSLGALAVGLRLRAMNRPSWGGDALVGLAIGLGAAAKYPLMLMGAVVVLAELLVAVKRRRLPARRLGGLLVSGAASAATFLAVLALVYGLGTGAKQLAHLPLAMRDALAFSAGAAKALPG